MAGHLFGIETEYALTALGKRGQAVDRGAALRSLMHAARQHYPSVFDGTGRGLFLANGARFYVDWPDHPEFSTPEVSNPWDAVRYVRAGDRILTGLAAEVPALTRGVAEVVLLRCNVDYGGTGSTWGCHESYLHTSDPRKLPPQIIPHLVSRLIYTGAGGFNSQCARGAEFTLSPRAWHLPHEISSESTHSRGIFHTKDEPLTGGNYHRLHILCGESVCSETAAWLKVATTALVVALIDAGVRPGDGVQLASPLAALRTFAADPTCRARARAADGREVSALDVQREYLRLAQAHLDQAFMPAWAAEACRRWAEVLDRLGDAPEAVSTVLDWAMKLALFKRRAQQWGVEWTAVEQWNRAARCVAPDASARRLREALAPADTAAADDFQRVAPHLRQQGLDPTRFERLPRLCRQLFEVDVRFGQLGESGLFTALDGAGVLAHHVDGVDNIEHAVAHPPATGRARLRGDSIRELGAVRDSCLCDWQTLLDPVGRRRLELSDPFAADVSWKPWRPPDPASSPPLPLHLDL